MATPAFSAAPVVGQNDAASYCQYIEGVAASESALKFSPQVFANGGVVNGSGTVTPETSSLPTTLRLTAGLRYSGMQLYQGLLDRQHAAAECARYQVMSELHTFIQKNRDVVSRPALAAKIEVLQAALPAAEEILRQTQEATGAGRATVDELEATAVRLDALRTELSQARQDLDSLADFVPLSRPVNDLLRAHRDAEEKVERLEAQKRQALAFDVTVQGGYDQTFGVGASSGLPVFGLLSLSFTPGRFWQPAADARARAGRLSWVREQVEGLDERVDQVLRKLSAVRKAELGRLKETRVLLADVEARMNAVESLPGDKVKRYRDYLYFDLVKLRAEHAYLRVHVDDLGASLAERTP